MSKEYAIALIFNLAAFGATAQGIVTITDEDNNVVNGTLVVGSCAHATDTVSLNAVINSANMHTVNVRRYEIWPAAGTKNFYCWGVCYLPVNVGVHPTWVSQDPVNLSPGVEYSGFHAYHQPQGNTSSTARYRYVWYDMANPNGADSSWVDIQFCGAVGIDEPAVYATDLTIFPQPSTGQDLQLDYTLDRTSSADRLVVHTLLGAQVRSINLSGTKGRITLAAGELAPGVYFANIEREGRVLLTRRVVIAK